MLVDDRNGLNELSFLAMLWRVQRLCPEGGAVLLQLLQPLGATALPATGGGAGHHPEQVGGYTGVPPLFGPIWCHTCTPSGGTFHSGAGPSGTNILE